MRLKLLTLTLVFFTFLSLTPVLAISQPSLEFEPDEYYHSLSPCMTAEITVNMSNGGEAAVQYVTLTAVIKDDSLIAIVGDATYEIFDNSTGIPVSVTTGTATLLGTELEHFAMWDDTYTKKFNMTTWMLPSGETLPGDHYVSFTFTVHCLAVGEARISVYPRSTEDHHETAPTLLSEVNDKKNLWFDGSNWYPAHNSYDPYDADLGYGHAWEPNSWKPNKAVQDKAFAKVMIYITQTEVPESPLAVYILMSIAVIAYLFIPKFVIKKKID